MRHHSAKPIDGNAPQMEPAARDDVKPASFAFAVVLLWLLAALGGNHVLIDYSLASARDRSCAQWPLESGIRRADETNTLLLFLHPKCSCSFATVRQLRNEMQSVGQPNCEITIAMYCPSDENESWAKTSLWRSADSIQGANMYLDIDGREAHRFGVTTSGHVLMFGQDGRIVFSGGITPSRAHEGSNLGAESLANRLANKPSPSPSTPVFGCALGTPTLNSPGRGLGVSNR